MSYEQQEPPPKPGDSSRPQPMQSAQGGAPANGFAGGAGDNLAGIGSSAGSAALGGSFSLAGSGGMGGALMTHPTPKPPENGGAPAIDHETWDTTGVYSADPDQVPGGSACGVCASNEVCHPGVGCELACDVASGLDVDAAWPIGGGCATRRGLSRYHGPVAPQQVFSLGLGAYPSPFSSALTLGSDRTIYAPAYDAYQARQGYLRIQKDGSTRLLDEIYGQVPVVTSNALYTAPGGLRSVDLNGGLLWDSVSGVADGDGPMNQSGELVVGADGTIYAGGFSAGLATLFAVSPEGALLWSAVTGGPVGLDSWPALSIDGTIYFGDSTFVDGGRLWAISSTGQISWHAFVGNSGSSFPAVAHDGNVFVSNGPDVWSFTPSGGVRFHYTQEHTADESFAFDHIAIGIDGTVFITYIDQNGAAGENSGVEALSNGGTELWSFSQTGLGVSAPVVDRDGNLFFSTKNTLHAFTPKGDRLWAQTIDEVDVCNSIVLGSDGTTYAQCDSSLYGFRDTPP